MANKSKITKKYARLALIFGILSFLCVFAPLLFYVGAGFLAGTAVVEKVVLGCAVFLAIFLSALCAINKWTFRSKIFIIILALYLVIDKFIVMILVFAITQVFDELVISPLARRFRAKASINAEIDKRGV